MIIFHPIKFFRRGQLSLQYFCVPTTFLCQLKKYNTLAFISDFSFKHKTLSVHYIRINNNTVKKFIFKSFLFLFLFNLDFRWPRFGLLSRWWFSAFLWPETRWNCFPGSSESRKTRGDGPTHLFLQAWNKFYLIGSLQV
jgi:hypothetical protein